MKTPEQNNEQLSTPASFCWNEACSDYGRVGAGNLRKFGFTRKGRQRWQCTTCGKVVAATRGTVFHGKGHDEQTILECRALLAERHSLAAIRRVKGIEEDTLNAWCAELAPQLERIEALLLRDYKLSRAQLDALWTYVGHKGEKKGGRKSPNGAPSGAARRSKPTRAYGSGALSPRPKRRSRKTRWRNSKRAAIHSRRRPWPPMAKGTVPEWSGRGRPPEYKQPAADWQYLQVVKHRAGGRVVRVEVEVIYGAETTVQLVGAHTAYVERTHLTARHINGRLARKTLSFAKALELLEATSVWEDAVYNLTQPVKTLRQEVKTEQRRYTPRSPMMAAGLTDHIWSIKELLWTVVPPSKSTRSG
jgi:transposase-like protein